MSVSILNRPLLSSIFSSCRPCLRTFTPLATRPFTTTTTRQADDNPLEGIGRPRTRKEEMRNLGLLTIFGPKSRQSASARPTNPSTSPAPGYDVIEDFEDRSPYEKKTHHFHIYSTKHNTHITLSNPDRDSIISLSAGNIGFRKGARGTYDAAYQLTTYVIGRMQEEGLLDKITSLEVVLRGFGIGREAVVKALLGTEGRLLRKKITQVTDSTRLKFGGTRSRKPRRLG